VKNRLSAFIESENLSREELKKEKWEKRKQIEIQLYQLVSYPLNNPIILHSSTPLSTFIQPQ
jgi:hypothetical protein